MSGALLFGRVLRSVAVASLLSVSVFAAQPALALDVDPAISAGRQLPLLPEAAPYQPFLDAGAPGYVAYDLHQVDEYETSSQFTIRRTSDGSVVRTVTWTGTPSPHLSPGGLVSVSPISADLSRRVVVSDIETGATTWTVDVPSDEYVVEAGATWVLSVKGPADARQAVLRRPGHDALALAGVVMSFGSIDTVANASTLVIHNQNLVWSVDLASGDSHLIADSAGASDKLVVTPRRVFVIDENAYPVTASWADVDGTNAGHVEMTMDNTSVTRGWVGYGDRLAAFHIESGDTGDSGHLEPVDLATGTREPAVATKVGKFASDGAGVAVITLGDTATGRVATVTDDGQPLHEVTALPVIGRLASSIGLSGSSVYGGFGWAYDSGTGPVARAAVDGSGSWSTSMAAGDRPVAGGLLSARGDVVLTQTSTGSATETYRVTWPGGYRDVYSTPGGWRLSRGGQVLVRGDGMLADAKSGQPLRTMAPGTRYVVDGRTLWQGPDAQGILTATDLDGVSPTRTVATGVKDCGALDLQVAGRFALFYCGDHYMAVDLHGVLAPQAVPWPRASVQSFAQLGNGYVAWVQWVDEPTVGKYAVATVYDLGPGHGTRQYGPLHGKYTSPDPMIAVDDAGGARLAYADTALQPRVVDLDWLTRAAWKDTVPPTFVTITGSPRASGSVVKASWTATDSANEATRIPSGVATYDVRYQQGPVGGPYAAWVQPAALRGLTAPTASVTGLAGKDTCLSVRATDHAGNTSAWSAPRCTATDVTAPKLVSTGGTPRTAPTRQVTISAVFTDPAFTSTVAGSGVGTYDVRYQQAAKVGGTFGAWTYPRMWQSSAAPTQTLTAGAGADTCFQIRARDKVGNVSGWSASHCSAVDTAAPTITAASTGALVVSATKSSAVTFSYKAADNTGVASYDVGYRYAPPRGALGALTRPSTWQATTATSQKLTVAPGGEVCFVVRARDRMGNTSAWSGARCSAVPYDDRALAGSKVSRITNSRALTGTVSRLNSSGATLSIGSQRGSRIAVVVLRGPKQGVVDVYAGSHKVGRVSLSSTTWRRDVVLLPTYAFTGTISIRSVSSAPSLIDALGVVR